MKKLYILLNLSFLFSMNGFSQCPSGQVMGYIDVETDNWGYECFWDLTPTGAGCGNGALGSFGNISQIGCTGAGNQDATGGNGYPDNTTITESIGCLVINDCYDINYIDDWGDGGATFTVTIMGISQGPFTGGGVGNIFSFCATVPSINNVDMAIGTNEYTIIPLSQIGNIVQDGIITSIGAGDVTGATMSVSVLLGATPVYSATSGAQNLNAGVTGIFSVPGYTPSAPGNYTIVYTSDIIETDEIPSDNVLTISIEVNDSVFARDNGINDIGGLGVGGGLTGNLGNIFSINTSSKVSSISAFIDNSITDITGNTIQMEVFSVDASGTPLTSLMTTELGTISGMNQWHTLRCSPPLQLTPGNYLFTIVQDATYQQQIGASSSIFTPSTAWVSWTNQPWSLAETFGYNVTFMIRPNFNEFAAISELSETQFTVYPNPAHQQLNIDNIEIGSVITIYDNLGKIVTISMAPTTNMTLDLSELVSGMYTIKICNNSKVGIAKFVKD